MAELLWRSPPLLLTHHLQIFIYRWFTQPACPRQFADVQLSGEVCGTMFMGDGGNTFLGGLGSADVLALGGGVCPWRRRLPFQAWRAPARWSVPVLRIRRESGRKPGAHPQDGVFQYCEYGGNLRPWVDPSVPEIHRDAAEEDEAHAQPLAAVGPRPLCCKISQNPYENVELACVLSGYSV